MKVLSMSEVDTLEKLEQAMADSSDHPVLLFKHSTRCGVSARANARVGEYLESKGTNGPDIRMVKVIEAKPVSNAVAEKLGVEHQSPQVILLKDGKPVWNASHHNIQAANIDAALAKTIA